MVKKIIKKIKEKIKGREIKGFDKHGIHYLTKSKYNEEGFSEKGYHKDTGNSFNKEGYDIFGEKEEGNFEKIIISTIGVIVVIIWMIAMMKAKNSKMELLAYGTNIPFIIQGIYNMNRGIKYI